MKCEACGKEGTLDIRATSIRCSFCDGERKPSRSVRPSFVCHAAVPHRLLVASLLCFGAAAGLGMALLLNWL
jgi:hypothetical protein